MDTDQNSIIETTQITMPDFNKKQDAISFFEKDENFVYVYKKTEKLATALYMVTNLFSDTEPMKWSLRKKVSDLLSFTIGYKNIHESQNTDFVDTVKTRVLEIVSLLEIASHSGLISAMNFSIIKQEFMNLINMLDKSESAHKESTHNMIPKSFFDTPNTPTQSRTDILDYAPKTQYIGPRTSQVSETGIKDRTATSPEQHVFARTNRQNIILQLLKKKKEITIKDVAQVIKNCSEKTIQRELVTLISLGILQKTGERRWSKYSLVS